MNPIMMSNSSRRWIIINCFVTFSLLTVIGCGDDENAPEINSMPSPTELRVNAGLKQLLFTWKASKGAMRYNLLENPDGDSGFTVIAGNISELSYTHDIAVHLNNWINASYIVEACNDNGCVRSNEISVVDLMAHSIGYIKASNSRALDWFGWSVALSADGQTLAVGTTGEDNIAGAVFVISRTETNWEQQAYVKASNNGLDDRFGNSVALSADGNTLAVGAINEDSAAKGIDGDQGDTTLEAGAVYVFRRTGAIWEQQAYVKASNTDGGDGFGFSVALSADGDTLAVGASGEDCSTSGINGDQADDTAGESGAVYVFSRSESTWEQQAYIKASNVLPGANFGESVALSADGRTLAVGASGEDLQIGAVYVFSRTDTTWEQQAHLIASNAVLWGGFGWSVALSADGHTLAVGTENGVVGSGTVYLFSRNKDTWQEQANVQAANSSRWFGRSVALSADGNILAVGAYGDASAAIGIGGDQTDISAGYAGAVYLFRKTETTWEQQAYIKASNTEEYDRFGWSVALSADGQTLAVGATSEDSAAEGINGNQGDNTADEAGAVYLY